MIIAKVIPLRRLPVHLDYFDYEVPTALQDDLHVGTLVQIPFQKSSAQGIVFQITEKSGTPDIPLKAIEKIVYPEPLLGEIQKKLLTWFANYYGISKASCIKMMVPPSPKKTRVTKSKGTSSHFIKNITSAPLPNLPDTAKPILYHSTNLNERYSLYLDLIKQVCQHDKQIIFLSPTIAEATQLFELLSAHNNESIALLHGELNLTDHFTTYRKIAAGEIKIIIGTRTALFCNAPQLHTIVIDQAERQEYKQSDQNPRYDARTVAYSIHNITQCKLILASSAPRIEEWQYYRKDQLSLIETVAQRPAITTLNLKDEFTGGNYTFLGDRLAEKLDDIVKNNQSAFLFINRKGESSVVCKQCDNLFSCETCNLPLRYFARAHELSCSSCGKKSQLPDQCPSCGGMEYRFPGIGIEKIAKTIQKLYPEYTTVILEQTNKKAVRPESWEKTILLGTTYALINHPDLFAHTSLTAMITADPITNLTNFRSQEYQWQTLAQLITLTTINPQPILLQSFNPLQPFITTLTALNYADQADVELSDRSVFSLPPFATHIDLMYHAAIKENATQALNGAIEMIKKQLADLDKSQNFPKISINIFRKNQRQSAIRIRLKQATSPITQVPEELTNIINTLPQGWMRDIDPLEA